MRTLFKLSILLLLLGAAAATAFVWFALADRPLVTASSVLSHEDIARAKAILQRHDPRAQPAGTTRTIELGEQDLNLAANYLLKKVADGDTRLALHADRLQLQATVRLPPLVGPRYLNIRGTIDAADGRPRLSNLRVGRVPVPDGIARRLLRVLLERWAARGRLDAAADVIERLQLLPDRVRLSYRWDPGLLDQARDTLLTAADLESLRYYHDQLLELQAAGHGLRGPVVELLQPLFAAALVRSRTRDAAAENTALLTVLGTWASHRDTRRLVPESSQRPQRFRLRLQRRIDFAQHFLTSAALAARGDSTLSDAVGLFKEIADSDRGSGFSFADIAADRAGTRFGELASRSAGDAARVQRLMAAGVDDDDIMPAAADLPENMDTRAFQARFGQVGSPAYRSMMREIETRIDASGLYHD